MEVKKNMDVSIPILFYFFGFICFLLALLEERTEKKDENESDKSDHLIIYFFMGAIVFFAAGGAALFGITDYLYDYSLSTWVYHYYEDYYIFGVLGIGWAIFCGFLMTLKIIEMFSHKVVQHEE